MSRGPTSRVRDASKGGLTVRFCGDPGFRMAPLGPSCLPCPRRGRASPVGSSMASIGTARGFPAQLIPVWITSRVTPHGLSFARLSICRMRPSMRAISLQVTQLKRCCYMLANLRASVTSVFGGVCCGPCLICRPSASTTRQSALKVNPPNFPSVRMRGISNTKYSFAKLAMRGLSSSRPHLNCGET